ncbi:hypothetical protein EJ08DRAFT_698715 [Tothia fuscella]|uniref:C2H2-type domain-containing protein n=1 Tax=Tothia fuscella TaxID=1048955 RepID=A0A9P4NN81_9PEZI|nr:hypothetical protein EJ08DRAFT_698715 [Tothia fuscella]
MATMQFDSHMAPKRSNSGREIMYVFPQQNTAPPTSVSSDVIPQDVAEVFKVLRKYHFKDVHRWLKIDRQDELNRNSMHPGQLQMADQHRMNHGPRLSVASTHASSRASSVFSAGAKRISVASSNTTYSAMSEPAGRMSTWEPQIPQMPAAPPPPVPQVQLAHAVSLNRKNSATLVESPRMKQSRASVATTARPSPRQRENDVEAKKKYFCTSCNKGFARKYDWKVHEQRYHEQQTQFPCPDCNQILFAETLFKSHHRDAHGCQECPHAKTVAKDVDMRRRRTAWGCGFCSEILDDWEKRCDHVAGHYDNGIKREEWDHSKVIIGLLRQPAIDQEWRSFLMQRHGQFPTDLGIRFSKEATGRSHGENSVQLQDLLEFGACPRDVSTIVQAAYEHGYRRPSSVMGTSPLNTNHSNNHNNGHTSMLSPPFSVQDTIMESPIVDTHNLKQESPVQFMTPANSSPLDSFELPINQLAYQTPCDSRMSSVGPSSMTDWAYQQQPQMYQQPPQYQMQQSNRMSTMSMQYVDKALPPIPPSDMGENPMSEHSITPRPSNINQHQQQQQHIDPHVNHTDFDDSWSLVGSTLVDEGHMAHNMFPTSHY